VRHGVTTGVQRRGADGDVWLQASGDVELTVTQGESGEAAMVVEGGCADGECERPRAAHGTLTVQRGCSAIRVRFVDAGAAHKWLRVSARMASDECAGAPHYPQCNSLGRRLMASGVNHWQALLAVGGAGDGETQARGDAELATGNAELAGGSAEHHGWLPSALRRLQGDKVGGAESSTDIALEDEGSGDAVSEEDTESTAETVSEADEEKEGPKDSDADVEAETSDEEDDSFEDIDKDLDDDCNVFQVCPPFMRAPCVQTTVACGPRSLHVVSPWSLRFEALQQLLV
jgi:hypothetical protein